MRLQITKDFLLFPLRIIFSHDKARRWGLTSLKEERIKACLPHIRGLCLDMGCGEGNELIKRYGQGIGADVYRWKEVDILCDAACLPFKDKSFDTITYLAVFGHILEKEKAFEEGRRVLNPGGRMLITFINPWLRRLRHKLTKSWDKDQLERRLAPGEEAPLWPAAIKRLAKKTGLKFVKIKRFVCGLNNLVIIEKECEEERFKMENYIPKVCVVVPVYNEEEVLKDLIPEFVELQKEYGLIIVDDGSRDKTFKLLSDAGLKLIRHPYNKGYGAALKTAARASDAEFLVVVDADGQHSISDIDKLISKVNEYDMVIGARTRDSYFPPLRRPGKWLLVKVAEFLVERKIPDLNSGFRIIRRSLLLEFLHFLPNSFSFSTTVTLAFLKAGYSVGYVPVKVHKRRGRRSNVSFSRDGLRTLLLILRVIMLFNPLKVFVPVSTILFTVGATHGLYHVIREFNIPDFSVLLLLTSVFTFLFGLLGDQVSAIRREIK